MSNRFRGLALAALLAAAACGDDAGDHREEAADAREQAAEEQSEGDTTEAREALDEAARHDAAAAPGDSTRW
jgi:Tfp pilus assembly protein PilF